MNTLVIDTSFGSTVGITGHEPICEQDSRTHVEKTAARHRASLRRGENTTSRHRAHSRRNRPGTLHRTTRRHRGSQGNRLCHRSTTPRTGFPKRTGHHDASGLQRRSEPAEHSHIRQLECTSQCGRRVASDPQRQRRAPQTALLHPARKHQRRHQRRTHPTRHEHRHAIEHRGQSKRSGRHHTATPSRPADRRRHRRTRCKQIRANLEPTTLKTESPSTIHLDTGAWG